METILTILFSVLTIFLSLVTLAFAIVAVFFILMAKNLHQFFKVVKEEGGKIVKDIEELRNQAKSGGVRFASMALSALSFFKHHKKSKEK